MNRLKFTGFVLFILLALSCNRDDDTELPTITVISPGNLTTWNVFDFIPVQASITDDQQLESVTVTMVNANLQPVLTAATFSPASNSYDLNTAIYVDDIHLASGTYYVKIVASDGTNDEISYTQINLNEEPKVLKETFVVSAPSSAVAELYRLNDNSNGFDFKQSFTGDYKGSSVSSYDQYVLMMGSFTGDLVAYDPDQNAVLWTVSNAQNPPFPFFNDMYYDADDRLNYVSLTTGLIRGYDDDGNIDVNAVALAGNHPQSCFGHEDLLFTEEENFSTGNKELVVRFKISGSIKQTQPMTRDVVGFATQDTDNIFTFGNVSGQGIMSIYGINGNYFWEPHSIPIGAINDFVQLDPNTYLIAHETGIFSYSYQTNSLITLVSGINPSDLVYDDVNNVMIAAVGNQLNYYSLSGNLINVITHASTIEAVHLYYNK
jgi:hypothetical protein